MTEPLTHYDEHGAARMVDVADKPVTRRVATASGRIEMQPATVERVRAGTVNKGNVLEVARLAGIMAAKKTGELIPLCHPLPLDGVEVSFELDAKGVAIRASVVTTARTGVEMEALTAATVAALTIYDMLKSMDRGMVIGQVRLDAKSGGRSGDWTHPQAATRATPTP